ncbi:unnamed protein product [Dicrocoelium dendriticum]|nr:unnamed protein product [Dicrocoelium dendriticum]
MLLQISLDLLLSIRSMHPSSDVNELDSDEKVWSSFENQLDNIFLILSSTNSSADADASETRHGLNEKHMRSFLNTCRDLDSWFVKMRFLLSTRYPDLVLHEELDIMRSEIVRKEKLITETKLKLKQYSECIAVIVEQISKDLSHCSSI